MPVPGMLTPVRSARAVLQDRDENGTLQLALDVFGHPQLAPSVSPPGRRLCTQLHHSGGRSGHCLLVPCREDPTTQDPDQGYAN